jgi:hypothetical protein
MWPHGKLNGGERHHQDLGEMPDLAGLAETIGNSVSAATVFGQPVNRGRTTVIPVAKARYGLGGARLPWLRSGSGAGGAMKVSPAGYLLLRGSRAWYRPISARSWPVLIIGLALLAAVGALLPFVITDGGLRRAQV